LADDLQGDRRFGITPVDETANILVLAQ
jgi:hypothetical protein